MARNSLGGLAVAAGAIAVGALFGRKKKKEAEKKRDEAERRVTELSAETSMDPIEPETFVQQNTERKCPSCGNTDTTGASSCPICFADMSGGSKKTGFEEY